MKAYIAVQSRRHGWFYKPAKSLADAHRQARGFRKSGARFAWVLDEMALNKIQAQTGITKEKIMEATQ